MSCEALISIEKPCDSNTGGIRTVWICQQENVTAATVSGGAAWQAVKTTNFNVTAKEGYFVNTTTAAITATLPSSPTLGDFVSFIDYAATFDTNNLTIARNGKNIQGVAEDLTVSVERAAFTLVYFNATQGWVLKNK